jgi:hypothetical protein
VDDWPVVFDRIPDTTRHTCKISVSVRTQLLSPLQHKATRPRLAHAEFVRLATLTHVTSGETTTTSSIFWDHHVGQTNL